MISADQLTQTFVSNHRLICRFLEGISHEESLLTPNFQANCMNWVLGHILVGRNRALKALQKPPVWGIEETDRYKTGSEPIEENTSLPLEKIHTLIDEAQANLELALSNVPADYLGEIISTSFGERPRWQHISSLGWHETYHVGQLELFRQLALDQREKALA